MVLLESLCLKILYGNKNVWCAKQSRSMLLFKLDFEESSSMLQNPSSVPLPNFNVTEAVVGPLVVQTKNTQHVADQFGQDKVYIFNNSNGS